MPDMDIRNGAPPPMTAISQSTAIIFDVDGVILDSPHEQAWRAALVGFADPARFTSAFYQRVVAGKPRHDGAIAALAELGVPDAASRALDFAVRKQVLMQDLIAAGSFTVYPDALRAVHRLRGLGYVLAVASSSKNANAMLEKIAAGPGRTLRDMFTVNVCGRDLPHGKPDPAIFLLAAAEAGVQPPSCLVVEDAASGILAAKAGGMAALGIARHDDAIPLRQAGADLVVADLDGLADDMVPAIIAAARGEGEHADRV